MTSTTARMTMKPFGVYLLVITTGLNMLLTGADCAMLAGLVAPIEVIEEWGCYDTEIRLTCGNLESRVAILEAKFTPHCAEDRPEECVHVDENSVTHSFSSQRVDKLTLEEKEAGQRFLQTLRRNHREHEKSPGEMVPLMGAVHSANGSTSVPVSARTVKDKRSSLRATLEHLIVRYLRRITSSGEDEEDEETGGYEVSSVRYRRQVVSSTGDLNGTGTTVEFGGGDNSTEVVGNEGPESSVEITLLTNDSDISGNGSAMVGSDSSEITEASGLPGGSSAVVVESANGGSFSTAMPIVDEKSSKLVDDGGERPVGKGSRKHKAKKKECTSIRKRIAQLDRFEMEKSMRNDSFREYNIRSALNYRCSGKNHCSFVFAQDHPFAVVWKEGTVRVKYICMDDFRISKYCDEHLIIGNEDQWERRTTGERDVSGDASSSSEGNANESPAQQHQHHDAGGGGGEVTSDGTTTTPGRNYYNDNSNDPVGFAGDRRRQRNFYDYDEDSDDGYGGYGDDDDPDEDYGEPRAEALQQLPMVQQMHSFHNLKILKTFPSESVPINETEQQRKLDAEATYRKRQKVFSQDFRVLKILPSNLDEIEDIKQVGNEYFFKKDVEVTVDDAENEIVPDVEGDNQLPSSTNEANNQFTETLDIVVLPPPTKDADVYESVLDGAASTASSGTTINSVELATPTIGSRVLTNVSQTQDVPDQQVPHTTLGSSTIDGTLESYPNVESNEVEEEGARVNKTSSAEDGFSFNNRTFRKMQEAILEGIHEGPNGDGGPYPTSYDDDDEDDFEDEDDDSDDFDGSDRRGHKKYISIQRTLLKHPLRQGFLMTPGYPKYYIGDSVCRWTLYAQRHQKIKLTILDLALRYDEPCRDYIEIRDLDTNQTLFSSCSESTRPVVVVSIREKVEVKVRTTTKVAYPKRGVLIHYSEKRATEGSGLVSHYEQKRKISDSETMSDKKADTVYDILIPSMVIAALFIVNGIVFAVIMRYRNKRKQRLELDSKELAEL
ncbi:uncharacterized protein LOC5575982 isoform X2 [Aedes aegypti]|uniref:CUB domain-containing protein n=1 Tax=Aedes aegypti TaxID=7159 RepID=A0A903V376_AEDAE|nr:uncharacterized protein LOC5575982 isoform X2 [Aedes aegypti]